MASFIQTAYAKDGRRRRLGSPRGSCGIRFIGDPKGGLCPAHAVRSRLPNEAMNKVKMKIN